MSIYRERRADKPLPQLPSPSRTERHRRHTHQRLTLCCISGNQSARHFEDISLPFRTPRFAESPASSTPSFKTARQSGLPLTRPTSKMTLRSIKRVFKPSPATTEYRGPSLTPQAYAHVFDRISFFLDSRSLLNVRCANRSLQQIADARLLHHISLNRRGLAIHDIQLKWEHALSGWIQRSANRVRIVDLSNLSGIRDIDREVLTRLVQRFHGNIVLRVLKDGEVPVSVPAISVIHSIHAQPESDPPIFQHPGRVFAPKATTVITHIRYEASTLLALGSLRSFGFGLRRTVLVMTPLVGCSRKSLVGSSSSRLLGKLPYGIVMALKLAAEGTVTLVGTEAWDKAWFGAEDWSTDIQTVIYKLVVEKGMELGWSTEAAVSAMRRLEMPSFETYRRDVGDEFYRLVMEE